MKRAKSEHMNATLHSYLKRRQFSESDTSSKKESRWTQNVLSLSLKGSPKGETSTDNSLSYTNIHGDMANSETQFLRLKSHLIDVGGCTEHEVQTILLPVFVHMCTNLLLVGQRNLGHRFCTKHKDMFKSMEKFTELLDTLVKSFSRTRTEVLACEDIQKFREMKFKISLKRKTLNSLNRFLKVIAIFRILLYKAQNDDNMIVIQIFNEHIKLTVNNKRSSALSLVEEIRESTKQQPISPAVIPDNKVVQDDAALSSLKQIIKDVRDGPAPLPSICFYTFLNAYQGQEQCSLVMKCSTNKVVQDDAALSSLKQIIKDVRECPALSLSLYFYTFLNAYQGLCCACISSDNEYLSGGFESSSVKIWKLTPGLFPSVPDKSGPTEIYLSTDYIQSEEGEEESQPSKSSRIERETVTLKGHTSSVYQTKFTWDSAYLLSCSEDKTVRLWDISKQQCAAVYRGHNYPVWDIDTSLVGDYFVSGSQDQTAKLWCTERIYPLRSFVGHTYDVDCVRFHPNGNYIATGSGDKTVRLWSIQEGKSVRLLQGHKSSVLSLAFSPNGMLLASAGEDRRVRVWDLRTGLVMKEYRGHTETIHSLAFNQSNNILASGGLDCNIRLWDTRKSYASSSGSEANNNPELLGSFPTKSTPVTYLNFTDHNVLQAAGAV